MAAQQAEQRFGANTINFAKSLDLVAEISRTQGDLAGAAHLYNRSLAIQEKILGPLHPRVIKTLCTLADLNAQQNRIFEARALYEKALAAAQKANRADDLVLIGPISGLAKLDKACGNHVQCRQHYEQILAICPRYTKYQPNLSALISETLQDLKKCPPYMRLWCGKNVSDEGHARNIGQYLFRTV